MPDTLPDATTDWSTTVHMWSRDLVPSKASHLLNTPPYKLNIKPFYEFCLQHCLWAIKCNWINKLLIFYSAVNSHLNLWEKWIGLPAPSHQDNQTQIENILLPISVWVSIFPACWYDAFFFFFAGYEGGDNISGLGMRFEFHGPISFRIWNWPICILHP